MKNILHIKNASGLGISYKNYNYIINLCDSKIISIRTNLNLNTNKFFLKRSQFEYLFRVQFLSTRKLIFHLPTPSIFFSVASANGPTLNITKVKRDHMGPYLCIASNGVPPSISKRIMLIVQCKCIL